MTTSHYEIEIVLKRIDKVSAPEPLLSVDQQRYADRYGYEQAIREFGLGRPDKIETIEMARATLKADEVAHLNEKVTGLIESYQPQPTGPKPLYLIGVFDDRHAYNLPTSMVATTESDFFEPEPVNSAAEAPVEDPDGLAEAADLPTTRGRRVTKKAAAAPADKRPVGRPRTR